MILVVDDEQEVRDALVEALTVYGYRVLAAADGEQALTAMRESEGIGMLISDIRMPGMSGQDLAEQARAMNPRLKVLLVSGYFKPQQIRERFLRKPFRIHELVSAVRSELG